MLGLVNLGSIDLLLGSGSLALGSFAFGSGSLATRRQYPMLFRMASDDRCLLGEIGVLRHGLEGKHRRSPLLFLGLMPGLRVDFIVAQYDVFPFQFSSDLLFSTGA